MEEWFSEARAPFMHNGVYGSYGFDGDEEDYQNLCPDYIIGPGTGVGAWAWGGEAAGEYWAERYFLIEFLTIMEARYISFRECTIGMSTHIWLFQQ